jgi:hypothetical protein
MLTKGAELKTWFLRVNSNSKVIDFNYDNIINYNFFSATISEDIKQKFVDKLGNPDLEYAGSVLQVGTKDGDPDTYNLNSYFIGKSKNNGYIIGFLVAVIINLTIDWKKYINSKKYINIDISPEDIIINNTATQGFKNGCTYTNNRITLFDNGGNALTEFLEKKYKVRNFVEIVDNKANFLEPNYFKYIFTTITPSIYILSNSISKLAKSSKSRNSNKNNFCDCF